jgi:hypothetical protein
MPVVLGSAWHLSVFGEKICWSLMSSILLNGIESTIIRLGAFPCNQVNPSGAVLSFDSSSSSSSSSSSN